MALATHPPSAPTTEAHQPDLALPVLASAASVQSFGPEIEDRQFKLILLILFSDDPNVWVNDGSEQHLLAEPRLHEHLLHGRTVFNLRHEMFFKHLPIEVREYRKYFLLNG